MILSPVWLNKYFSVNRKNKSYLDDDSKIIDINFAKEQSNFLRLQILKQSAKAALS